MSEIAELRQDTSMLTAEAAPLTALAHALSAEPPAAGSFTEARGSRTLSFYSDVLQELSALLTGAAAFDGGARRRLRITGDDRVRWLNGMVTNSVKTLAPGSHHYTFVLNAQGRIQGDATVFAFADHLILETDRAQADRLFAHLDRFIIMDDVELAWIEGRTTLGVAGPRSEALLSSLGLPTPPAGATSTGELTIVREDSPSVRRFSLWLDDEAVAGIWQGLLGAGATPAGALAVDALRVLEGVPLYGIDIGEKTLAQETGQTRALNFNKGCYLGQEIVERVRSRANVHRAIRQFALLGEPAAPGMPLLADGAPVGELTSVARTSLPGLSGQVALGFARLEALERTLTYPGGSVTVLDASPLASPTHS